MPGAPTTLGIIGGGQLGMMLARAAGQIGIACVALDPDPRCCAAQACEVIAGAYDDPDALDALASRAGVVTYEFENVPVESARRVMARVPVRPDPAALETAQDRLNERSMFDRLGIQTPRYARVDSLDDLRGAIDSLGTPALLKARRLGYDGKGQALVSEPGGAGRAWEAIGRVPAILDAFVPFAREVSVIACRGLSGVDAFYPIAHNVHRGGILRVTRAPAPGVRPSLASSARDAAAAILDELGYVGVLAVEFFQVGDGDDACLLANEIAPRVHNTGHWTIEGARTGQFENHVRAVCGMELGAPDAVGHSAMINIIGSEPRRGAIESLPGAAAHMYRKPPRPGRKLGHVTITGATRADVEARLEQCTRVVG